MAQPARRWLLIAPDGKRHVLQNAYITIGRNEDRDIFLEDPRISRRHAILQFEGGTWYLSDTRSTNGTFVNGLMIGQRHILHPGDEITFGDTSLTFTAETLSAAIEAVHHLDTAPTLPATDTEPPGVVFSPVPEPVPGASPASSLPDRPTQPLQPVREPIDRSSQITGISPRILAILRELATGTSKKAMVRRLIRTGMSPNEAEQLVHHASNALPNYRRSPVGQRVLREHNRQRMLLGGLLFVMALAATILMYIMVEITWQHIFLWIAVLLGAVDFLVGFVRWAKLH
jgi:pSer/pThr/pTyr-binding forkhead associated (FHA) protein